MENPLPNNIDTEKTIIASCILSDKALNLCSNELTPSMIYDSQCRQCFKALVEMHGKGIPVDIVALPEHIPRNEKIQNVEYFISDIVENCSTTPNPSEHIKIIKEKFRLREIIKLCASVSSEAFEEKPSNEILSLIEKNMAPIKEITDNYKKETTHIKDLIVPMFEYLDDKKLTDRVSFGIRAIDKKTGGLNPGELVIIAGRPSMGKSAIMNNIAMSCGKTVLIFSLEMTERALLLRMFSSECKVNASNLRSKDIAPSERRTLYGNATPISEKNIFINDNPSLTVYDIRNISQEYHKKHNVGLIMVDYLQKIRDTGFFQNKRLETAEKSSILKNMAKELNIPVIALAQLSRACEQRPDKRPFMSDLREAGEIEQDADMVSFIYRPYVYRLSEDPGETEFIIAKQREGETGIRKIKFIPQYLTFEDYPENEKPGKENF